MDKSKRDPRGRPAKTAQPGQRVSLGLKLSWQTKNLLDRLATETGRTQAGAAEHLIERALQYDRLIAAMLKTNVSAKRFVADVESGRRPRRKPKRSKQ
jgi:hypothetical protein